MNNCSLFLLPISFMTGKPSRVSSTTTAADVRSAHLTRTFLPSRPAWFSSSPSSRVLSRADHEWGLWAGAPQDVPPLPKFPALSRLRACKPTRKTFQSLLQQRSKKNHKCNGLQRQGQRRRPSAEAACTTSARSELSGLKAAPSLQHWLSKGAQALPGPGLAAARPQRWERSGLCCRWVCVWQQLPGQMAVALTSCSFGPAQLPQQQFQCCKLFIALGMLFKPTLLMCITDNQRQLSVGAWGDGRRGRVALRSRHGQAASWKSGVSLNRVKASISAHCGACTITEK